MLWQNRDPLVRASALQLLAGLMNTTIHTASQLFNAIAMAPSDLCHTLLQCITNRDESCLVREQACIAFCNMLKNCNSVIFQYVSAKVPLKQSIEKALVLKLKISILSNYCIKDTKEIF